MRIGDVLFLVGTPARIAVAVTAIEIRPPRVIPPDRLPFRHGVFGEAIAQVAHRVADAIGEFAVARQGCLGKKKEVDCLSMMGALQLMKGDTAAAVDAFKLALTSEHGMGEAEKALRYELAMAYEQANDPGRALAQYLKVQQIDGGYREVQSMVDRLVGETTPVEDDAPPPPKGGPPRGGAPAGARKVGYL